MHLSKSILASDILRPRKTDYFCSNDYSHSAHVAKVLQVIITSRNIKTSCYYFSVEEVTGFFKSHTAQVWELTTSDEQCCGKTITTAVLQKDETLLWSVLCWHQSFHSNIVTSWHFFFFPSYFSVPWVFFVNRSLELLLLFFFSQCWPTLNKFYERVFESFEDEVLRVKNTVKTILSR